MKLKTKIGAGLMALGIAATVMAAKENKKQAEMEAKMEQAMKLGMPGQNHKVLEPLIGTWTHTAQFWMQPGEKPQQSSGGNENTWVLGGRFLKQDVKGTYNGKPFEGVGFTGYDNLRQEYQSIWMDNMMSGIMQGSGTYDPATKTLTQTGTFSCPVTGNKEHWYKAEWKILNEDSNVYSSYDKTPEGKEFKAMEIVYKRVKKS